MAFSSSVAGDDWLCARPAPAPVNPPAQTIAPATHRGPSGMKTRRADRELMSAPPPGDFGGAYKNPAAALGRITGPSEPVRACPPRETWTPEIIERRWIRDKSLADQPPTSRLEATPARTSQSRR